MVYKITHITIGINVCAKFQIYISHLGLYGDIMILRCLRLRFLRLKTSSGIFELYDVYISRFNKTLRFLTFLRG